MEFDRDVARRVAVGLGLLALLALTAYVVAAFVASVVFAVFLYYAVRPIFRFLDRFPLGRRLRATAALLLFGLPFLVLIAYTVAIIAVELRSFLEATGLLGSAINRLTEELNIAELDLEEIETLVTETDSVPSADLVVDSLLTASSAVGGAFLQLFIVVGATYYMLVGGPRTVEWFLETFDDSGVFRRYFREVDSELSQTLFGNIVNIFVTAIIAGLTFYGFNLLVPSVIEIPYPTLAGVLVGVGTLIPVIGIKLVYVPVVVGIGARAWMAGQPELLIPVAGLLVVSAVVLDFIPDVFARARFSGDRTHNGLLMLAYIMGPTLFGFYGLFLAPILLISTAEGVRILLPYVLSGDATAPEQATLSAYAAEPGAELPEQSSPPPEDSEQVGQDD
jgi:predicted PurR-regulated permease PerM